MLWWWIWRLKSHNYKAQWEAAWKLGKSGDIRAIDPLVDALKTGDKYLSPRAAEGLGLIRDSRVVGPLIEALEHKDLDTRNRAHEALVKLSSFSKNALAVVFSNRASSVPVDQLTYGEYSGNPAKAVALVLGAIGWEPPNPHQRVLFALALGNVFKAVAEGTPAIEPLLALLNHRDTRIRERTATALNWERKNLPDRISARVEEILAHKEALEAERKHKLAQEREERINRFQGLLGERELGCLNCGNVQREGDWERAMDDRSKAAGMMGFVNINAEPKCLACDSTDLHEPTRTR